MEAIHRAGLESCDSPKRASQSSSMRPSWGATRLSAWHGGADIMSHISQSFNSGRNEKNCSTISTSAWNAPPRLTESLVRLSGCSRRSGPCAHVEPAHATSDGVHDLPAHDPSLDEPPDKSWATIAEEDAKEQPNRDVECIDASSECIDASKVDVRRTSSLRCRLPIAGPLAGKMSSDGSRASAGKVCSDASRASHTESEASLPVRRMTSTKSDATDNSLPWLSCESIRGAPARLSSKVTGTSSLPLPGSAQLARHDTDTSGRLRPRSSMAPSWASEVSKVNSLLRGRTEDVARAASLSEGSTLLDDEVNLPRLMLAADSRVHVALATLMIIAIVYTGLLSPIVLAYFHGGGMSPVVSVPMHVADALWLVFVVTVFRSAIYDKGGSVIVDAWQIAAHYSRTWLLLDLLCAWPACLVPDVRAAFTTCMLLKLLRTPRLAPLISMVQKQHQVHVLSPLKWGLMLLLMTHSMTCFWRLVQCDIDSPITSGAGQGSPDLYCDGDHLWHMYVSDLYWVTMTLSTVGYGDIHPYNTIARVFAIFVMFLSPIFFGSVVAALTNVLGRIFDEKLESSVSAMSRFMVRHRVPLGLQRRVERSLRQVLSSEDSVSPLDPELFVRLSPALQRTFSFAILNGTIGRFPLFTGAIHSFVAEMAQAHLLVNCSAGDLVGEAGQLVQDLAFVVNGSVVARFSVSWPDKLDVPVEEMAKARERSSLSTTARLGTSHSRTLWTLASGSSGDLGTARSAGSSSGDAAPALATGSTAGGRRIMGRGAWFGESCVVSRQHVRTASLIAQEFSELAVLNWEAFARVLRKYPAMVTRHELLLKEMDTGTIGLADISWTGPPRRHNIRPGRVAPAGCRD
ncbi:unnamed protein product [Prorocentrum cordatum]|uniref:Cyclic nucleotide-binding domain-containing protein n=1 Tax=Prorocentrum cordatum TaxID=2364126 RepID=A0ABN9XY24_9DINO|nr:unnamed protein product [Polarella glacialis]